MNILNINRGNLNQENINSKLSIQLLLVLLILSNINRGYFREQNKNQVNTKSGYLLFLYSNI